MNFENMTNKEIRHTRNKLAIERQNNKKVVNDREYKQLVRRRERQVYQAKLQLYVMGLIFALFGSMIFGEVAFINFYVLLVAQIAIVAAIIFLYFVLPKISNTNILTYRIRYIIPAIFFYYTQLALFRYNPIGEYGIEINTIFVLTHLYWLIGIPIVMIQNWLEKRVYEEREKDIFQKFSWNDWYSEKIFEYEHSSKEELNAEIERILKIDEQIIACNQELKARKLEAKLTDSDE